jgi:hypothetical protein
MRWTRKKSIDKPRTIKSRLGVKVEPLEFTSSGGRGGALSRLVKSRFLTFYEVIIIDGFVKSRHPGESRIRSGTGTGVQKIITSFIRKLKIPG